MPATMENASSNAAASASRRELAGIAFLLVSVLCFAALDTTTKLVTLEVPLLMAVWTRHAVQAILTTTLALPHHRRMLFDTRRLSMQVLRGVLMTLITLLAFASLRVLPVGEFTAVVMTVPLVVTLLSAAFLGERVTPVRWLLVGTGFAGTLLIVRPGDALLGWAVVLPLLLVACNASFQLLTRWLARTERAVTTQFYTSWVCVILSSLPLPWLWTRIENPWMWAGMVFMGVAGGTGHFLFIQAFERARAVTLMPFMYAQIGFAMLAGWLVFGHLPDALGLVGIALITLSGVASGVITARENRRS